MVDKDPLARWTFGRVTLAGDAAHPMYPRGSNGAAQAAIDARTLADCLAAHDDRAMRLWLTEDVRREATAKVVRTNREHRRISSTSRWRSWSAISRSTISTASSRRTSCARCPKATSVSPDFRWRMSRRRLTVLPSP